VIAIAVLATAAVAAAVLASRDGAEGASDRRPRCGLLPPGTEFPEGAAGPAVVDLRPGTPEGLDGRLDMGFPWPTRSVAAYQDDDSFLLVVYEDGATVDDVLAYLRVAPPRAGWQLQSSDAPDPAARSLGALRYMKEGAPTVLLHFYDPSGGDQLRFGEEFGVQGPWVEVSLEGEGFG